jgi:hypothetical protein
MIFQELFRAAAASFCPKPVFCDAFKELLWSLLNRGKKIGF